MNKWENFGDINFFAYGGCLVKPHQIGEGANIDDRFKYCFDVFYLNPEFGINGDQNFTALCCIDLTDNWLDYDGMLETCGCEDKVGIPFEELVKIIDPMLLAKEMVEYYGVVEFNPVVYKGDTYIQYPYESEDFILTDEELNDWLRDIGAEEHCIDLDNIRD